jgi:hypothetical protein
MTFMKRNPSYLMISLFFAGIVIWGFWQSYFGPLLIGNIDRPWIVHFHAAIFMGWVLLLISQTALVATGNVNLHRQIGSIGMLYGAFVFLVGVLVSIGAPALRVRAGDFPIEVGGVVAIYSLADLLIFGVFLTLAFHYRSHPSIHKQWIIAATAALGGAAVGRPLRTDSLEYLLVWLSPLLVVIVIELVFRRKVSAVPFWGSAVIIVAFFKVQLFSAPIWNDIGIALLSPFV